MELAKAGSIIKNRHIPMRRAPQDEFKKLVPLKRIAQASSYGLGYVSILVQRKKLKAKKIGNKYYTTREWFQEYLELHARDEKRLPAEPAKDNFLTPPATQPAYPAPAPLKVGDNHASIAQAAADLKNQIDSLVQRMVSEKIADTTPLSPPLSGGRNTEQSAEILVADEAKNNLTPLAPLYKGGENVEGENRSEVVEEKKVLSEAAEPPLPPLVREGNTLAEVLNEKIETAEVKFISDYVEPEAKLYGAWKDNVTYEAKIISQERGQELKKFKSEIRRQATAAVWQKIKASTLAAALAIANILNFRQEDFSARQDGLAGVNDGAFVKLSLIKEKLTLLGEALKSLPNRVSFFVNAVIIKVKKIKSPLPPFVKGGIQGKSPLPPFIKGVNPLVFKPLAVSLIFIIAVLAFNYLAPQTSKYLSQTAGRAFVSSFNQARLLASGGFNQKYSAQNIETAKPGEETAPKTNLIIPGRDLMARIKFGLDAKLSGLAEQISFASLALENNLKERNRVLARRLNTVKEQALFITGFWQEQYGDKAKSLTLVIAEKLSNLKLALDLLPERTRRLGENNLAVLKNFIDFKKEPFELAGESKIPLTPFVKGGNSNPPYPPLEGGQTPRGRVAGVSEASLGSEPASALSQKSGSFMPRLLALANTTSRRGQEVFSQAKYSAGNLLENTAERQIELSLNLGQKLARLTSSAAQGVSLVSRRGQTKLAQLDNAINQTNDSIKQSGQAGQSYLSYEAGRSLWSISDMYSKFIDWLFPESLKNKYAKYYEVPGKETVIVKETTVVNGGAKTTNPPTPLLKGGATASTPLVKGGAGGLLNPSITGNTASGAQINTNGPTVTVKKLTVLDKADFYGDVTVNAALVAKTLTVIDSAQFLGPINAKDIAADSLTSRGGLTVVGDSFVGGNELISGNLKVAGTFQAGHTEFSSLGVTGPLGARSLSAGAGGLSVSGDTHLNGDNAIIRSAVTLNNILNINSNSASALTVGDGATDIFTVDVSNSAVTIAAALNLTGNNNFNGQLDLNGILDLDAASTSAFAVGNGVNDNFKIDTVNSILTLGNSSTTDQIIVNGKQLTLNSASSTTALTINYDGTGSIAQILDNGVERFSMADFGIASFTASSTSGTALTITQNDTGDILNLFDGASEVLTVLDGGNVGIGTSTPSYKLSINSSDSTSNLFQIATTTNQNILTVANTGKVLIDGYYGGGTIFDVNNNSGTAVGEHDIFSVGAPTNGASMSWKTGYYSDGINNSQTGGSYMYLRVGGGGGSGLALSGAYTATPHLFIKYNGNIGIASSSPWGLLSVNANGLTANTPQFVVGSSTATNFIVANNGNVGVGTASPGKKMEVNGDILISASSNGILSFGFSTRTADPVVGVSPGTHISFNEASDNNFGIGISALRNSAYDMWFQTGNASGGGFRFVKGTTEMMTISNTGSLGVGSTSPSQLLSVAGNAYFTGNLAADGTTGVSFNGSGAGITFYGAGNHDITASGGTLRIGSNTIIGNIQALDDTVDIGTPATRFDKVYANEVNATSLVGSIVGGNVLSETLTINQDNATADLENSYLAFERGSVSPNAVLAWDSAYKILDLNQPLYIQNDSLSSATSTLLVQGYAGQINDLLRVASSSSYSDTLFNVTAGGNVGIGTTSPWGQLSVNANGIAVNAPQFVIGSSTRTDLIVKQNGFVGIGTASPEYNLHVSSSIGAQSLTIPMSTANWTWQTGTYRELNDVIENSTHSSRITNSIKGDIMSFIYAATPWVLLDNSILTTNTNSYIQMFNALQHGVKTERAKIFWDSNTFTIGTVADGTGTVRNIALTGGNVGVGTTTPYSRLTAWGGAAGNIFEAVTNASSTALVINSSGNVGIGTTTPGAKLDVIGQAKFGGDPTFYENTAFKTGSGLTGSNVGLGWLSSFIGANVNYAPSVNNKPTIYESTGGYTNAGAIAITPHNAAGINPIQFWTGTGAAGAELSQAMVISNTGNVGIGTTSPWSNLSVNTTAGAHSFSIGSSTGTYLTVDERGNVGIGTVNPAAKLDVRFDSRDPTYAGIYSYSANGGWYTTGVTGQVQSASGILGYNDSGKLWSLYTSGGDVYLGGNVGIASTSPWGLLSVNANGLTANAPQFVIGSSTRTDFIVKQNGYVGIGTSNPTTPLYVNGKGTFQYIDVTDTSVWANEAGKSRFITQSQYPAASFTSYYAAGQRDAIEVIAQYQGYSSSIGSGPGILFKTDVAQGYSPVAAGRIAAVLEDINVPQSLNTSLSLQTALAGNVSEKVRITSTGNVGIGMTPSNILDISQNQNGASIAQIYNNDGGASARADFRLNNGTSITQLIQFGTAYTESTVFRADGTVLYGNGAGGLTLDTGAAQPIYFGINNIEKMRISSDGNVGIGTTSPWGLLSVNANGLTANAPQFVIGSSTRTDLIVTQAGNVGIGTAAPGATLQIGSTDASSVSANLLIVRQPSVPATTFPFMLTNGQSRSSVSYSTNDTLYIDTFYDNGTGTSEGSYGRVLNIAYKGAPNGSAGSSVIRFLANGETNGSNPTEIMRLSGYSGNVGIGLGGTTAASARLQVKGGDSLNTSLTANISGSTGTGLIVTNAGNVGIGTTSPYAKLSVTNTGVGPSFIVEDDTSPDATPFIVDTNGNVGIGTTNPTALLSVNYPSTIETIVPARGIIMTSAGGTAGLFSPPIYFDIGGGGGRASIYTKRIAGYGGQLFFNVDNTSGSGIDRMMINESGNVGIASTSPWGLLSVNADGITAGAPQFVIGSSTRTDFIVKQNGYVGIGTAAPSYALDVNGSIRIPSAQTIYFSTSQTNSQIVDSAGSVYLSANADLIFRTGGTAQQSIVAKNTGLIGIASTSPWGLLSVNADALTVGAPQFVVGSSTRTDFIVKQNGNVGVGIASPNVLLDVSSGSSIGSITALTTNSGIRISDTSSSAGVRKGLAFYSSGNGSLGVLAAIETNVVAGWDTNLDFYNRKSGSLTNVLHLNNTGNVGIGTSSPWANLSVNTTAGEHSFSIGSSTGTYLTVDERGNVGIGTASPNEKLEIFGNGLFSSIGTASDQGPGAYGGYNSYSQKFRGSYWNSILGPTNEDAAIAWKITTANTTAPLYYLSFSAGSAANVLNIRDDGNVGIGTTVPGAKLVVSSGVSAAAPALGATTGISSLISYDNTWGMAFGMSSVTGNGWIQQQRIDGTATAYSLLLQPSGGKVGIGTTQTPSQKLQIGDVGVAVSTAAPEAITLGSTFSNAAGTNLKLRLYEDTSSYIMGLGISNAQMDYVVSSTGFSHVFYGSTNELMKIKGTGEIGIASTSPWGLLSVNANALTAGAPQFVIGSSTRTDFIIKQNGNVGVGTVAPTRKLEVSANSYNAFLDPNTSTEFMGIRHATLDYGFGWIYDGDLKLNRHENDATGAVAMTVLRASGNVGIGTASPGDNKLSVSGNQSITGTANNLYTLSVSNDASGLTYSGTGKRLATFSATAAAVADRPGIDLGYDTNGGGIIAGATLAGAQSSINFWTYNGSAWGERVRINETGSLGIGTTSPWGKLSITQTGTAGAPAFIVEDEASPDATPFVVSQTGSVGIGTASPGAKLDVVGNMKVSGGVGYVEYNALKTGVGREISAGIGWGSSFIGSNINYETSAGTNVPTMYGSIGGYNYGGAMAINPGVNTFQFWTGTGTTNSELSNRMVIDYLGKIGVGTTSPWGLLSVNADGITANAPQFVIGSSTRTDLIVTQAGNVGIGTVAPGYKLDVSGGGSLGITNQTQAPINSQSLPGSLNFDGWGWDGPLGSLPIKGQILLGGAFNNAGTGSTEPYLAFSLQGSGGYAGSGPTSLTERLRINNFGNVGIGTTSPWGLLSVNADGITANAPQFVIGSSTRTDLIVTQAGNVGIGTAAPGSKLDVNNGDIAISGWNISHGMTNLAPTTNTGLFLGTAYNNVGGGYVWGFSDDADANGLRLDGFMGVADPTDSTPAMILYAAKKNGAGSQALGNVETAFAFNNSGTRLATILGSGNVGIGTTTPSASLTVYGDMLMNGSSRYLYFGTTTGATAYGFRDNSGTLEYKNMGGAWAGIGTGAGQWTTLNTDIYYNTGNVGIGTTTPAGLLNLASTLPRFYLSDTDAAADNKHWFMENNAGTLSFGTTTDALAVSATRALSITNAGNVGIGTTSPNYSLDVAGSAAFGTGAEAMRIDTTGNIGIGTTSPYSKLALVDTTSSLKDVFTISTSTSGLIFKVDSYGRTYGDGAYASPAADYAEYFYTNSIGLKSGEIVCVDIVTNNAVKRCERGADNNAMGIVSTKPSVIGNYIKESQADPEHYAIIGMLGQVDAYASAENGEINIGDSLTSASSTPGYAMRADGGDSTVGIALEPLKEGKGKIKVLISRRNKSLAVEEVEALVIERVANMKIEDRVQQLITQAVANLNLDPKIEAIAKTEANKLDSALTIKLDDVTGIINNLRTQTLASLTDLGSRITNYELRITENANLLASTTALAENIKIDEAGNLVIGSNPLNPPLQGGQNGTASTTPLTKGGAGGLVRIVSLTEITASSTQAAFVVNQTGAGDIADFQVNSVSVMNITSSGEVKVAGSMLVDGRIMLCTGGNCSNALDAAVDETMADLGVEGKVVAGAFEGYCDDGYVWVPGSAKYGTMPGFCVMADLAAVNPLNPPLQGGQIPTPLTKGGAGGLNVWTGVSQGEAQLACNSLGMGYHLIGENEWLTIAENILQTPSNSPLSGGGQAELKLTNDNVIYNLTGGIAQWTNQNVTQAGLPVTPAPNGWFEYNEIVDFKGLNIAPDYYLTDAANHIGKIMTGSGAGLRGFVRGEGGIYGLDLSHNPSERNVNIGFRCAK